MLTVWNLRLPAQIDAWSGGSDFMRSLEAQGGKLTYVGKLTPWVTITLPDDPRRDGPRALPGVEAAELDLECHTCVAVYPSAQQAPQLGWAAQLVGALGAQKHTKGLGVRVAVIDTGVSAHTELAGARFIGQESFVPQEGPEDMAGHGTAVISQIVAQGPQLVGIAPQAEILSLKALDANGFGQWSWVAMALERASDQRAQVIVMALGGPDFSMMVVDTLMAVSARGALIVAAAGNDGGHRLSFPAQTPYTLAVGAMTRDFTVPGFSSRGVWPASPDLVAPGVELPAAGLGGGIVFSSGTSIATAVAGGVMALYVGSSSFSAAIGEFAVDPKWGIALPATTTQARVALSKFSQHIPATRDAEGYGLIRADGLVNRQASPPLMGSVRTAGVLPGPVLAGAAVVAGAVALFRRR